MKRKISIKSISVLLIALALLFAYLAYSVSQKKIYRVTWGGVTNEFLLQAKSNPEEFKITKEPAIIMVDNRPEETEIYYSKSELASFTNNGKFLSVHFYTFKQYQKLPFFSKGPETKKKRTGQQTLFYSYLFLSFLCVGGALIFLINQNEVNYTILQCAPDLS